MLSKKQMVPDCCIALLCHPPHSSFHNLGPFTRFCMPACGVTHDTVNVAQQDEICGLPGAGEIMPGALEDGSDAGIVQEVLV